MDVDLELALPAELAKELEEKFFWWEPVSPRPRSRARVFAQAMDFASFMDVRRLESVVGPDRLAEIMLSAQPGWLSDRSWENLGHRRSLDFDFFRFEPLDKDEAKAAFAFLRDARILQEDQDTLVVMARAPAGPVKLSFLGNIGIGRINEPVQTIDSMLLVASLVDLLATKLKAILDRAEAKDYRDIAAMLSAGVSFETALGAFAKMYQRDPALPLKALGYFKDGDLSSLPRADQDLLRAARDRVVEIPDVIVTRGSLAVPLRRCKP